MKKLQSRKSARVASSAVFYDRRYHGEQTGEGRQPYLPGLAPVIIVGRNRIGKDAGIGRDIAKERPAK